MIRRIVLRMLAFVALVVAGATLAFAAPAPAEAAPQPIGLSLDGVTFADSLPASLFAGAVIVPGETDTRTFYVKNRTTLPGNLAVALSGVSGGDQHLITALSLRTTAGAHSGPNVPFVSANPCRSLISGLLLPPGAVMQVDVTLRMSNSLAHRTSQGSVGNFLIPVTLTSTDVAAPDGCAATTPVTPPVTPPVTDDPSNPPGTIGTAIISGAAAGTVLPTLDEDPLAGLGGNGKVRSLGTIPNTGRFWQEIDVAGYLIALAGGGIFAWWWRRRRPDEEESYA